MLPASTVTAEPPGPAKAVALLRGEVGEGSAGMEQSRVEQPDADGRVHGASHDVLGNAEMRSKEAAVGRRAAIHRLARHDADAAHPGMGRHLAERAQVGTQGPQDLEPGYGHEKVVVRR